MNFSQISHLPLLQTSQQVGVELPGVQQAEHQEDQTAGQTDEKQQDWPGQHVSVLT